MSRSNADRYDRFVGKVLNRLDRDVRMWYKEHGVDIPSHYWAVNLFSRSIRFIQRGRFTVCHIIGDGLCYPNLDLVKVSGFGFAHRMKHDPNRPEIGRHIALKRAIHDALSAELAGIKFKGE